MGRKFSAEGICEDRSITIRKHNREVKREEEKFYIYIKEKALENKFSSK